MMNALNQESNSKLQIEYVDLLLQDVETLIATHPDNGQLIISLNIMASSLHYLRGLITSEKISPLKSATPIIEPRKDRPFTDDDWAIVQPGLAYTEYDYEAIIDAIPHGLGAVRRAWFEMTCRLNSVINEVK